MIKIASLVNVVLAVLLLFTACKKEYSFEREPEEQMATGSLRSVFGECQPVTVNGLYTQNSILGDSDYVVVQVHFTSPGRYHIYSDEQNGFSFQDSAIVSDTGHQDIKLKAIGKPIMAQNTNFIVRFDTSICAFSIGIQPSPVVEPLPVNLADSAWEFQQENDFYHGYFDGASAELHNGSTILTLVGLTTTKDTAIAILVDIPAPTIKTGTYTSAASTTFLFFDKSGTSIYNADKTTAGAEVVIVIRAYDNATKIIEGTFGGTALNKANGAVSISGGKFKAQLD